MGARVPNDAARAQRFRERAKQLRVFASDTGDQTISKALSVAADGYDEMAASIEKKLRDEASQPRPNSN